MKPIRSLAAIAVLVAITCGAMFADAAPGAHSPFFPPIEITGTVPEPDDTRLVPHRADERAFVFAAPPSRVRVRVLHRRFWADFPRRPDRDLVVHDRWQ